MKMETPNDQAADPVTQASELEPLTLMTQQLEDLSLSTSDLSPRRKVENKSRKFEDFKILRMIGTGTFGKVYLGLLDEKPVAIKCLKKHQILKMKQTEHIKQEKEVLAEVDHPFIVNM